MAAGTTSRNMYKLNKALGLSKRTSAQRKRFPKQGHHLISCSVMNDSEFTQVRLWAKRSGYDINRKSNGIAMPAYFGHMRKEHLQRHRGGHDAIYYDEVRNELRRMKTQVGDSKKCPTEEEKKDILGKLTRIENRLRQDLVARDIWLYNWSEELYEADYRDEGAGKLTSARGRQDGFAAGKAWNQRYPKGTVRRRHTGDASKAKVNAAWYQKWNYPKPGDVT